VVAVWDADIVRLAVAEVAVEVRVTFLGLMEATSPPEKGPYAKADNPIVPLKFSTRLREIVEVAEFPWRRMKK